jgi:hypothetical protein
MGDAKDGFLLREARKVERKDVERKVRGGNREEKPSTAPLRRTRLTG